MPSFIVRSYPSLVDIYSQHTTIDEGTNETVRDWDYLEYDTTPCAVSAVSPEDSLEIFGDEYAYKKFVRLEVPSGEWSLDQRAGNLRSKAGKPYYQRWTGERWEQERFNISGMTTQVDLHGQIAGYELYLELVD